MKTSFILLSVFAAIPGIAADPDPHQQAVQMITSGSDISRPREEIPVARELAVARETDAQQKAASLLDRSEANGPFQSGAPVRVMVSYPNDAHAYGARLLGGPDFAGSGPVGLTQFAGESKAAQ